MEDSFSNRSGILFFFFFFNNHQETLSFLSVDRYVPGRFSSGVQHKINHFFFPPPPLPNQITESPSPQAGWIIVDSSSINLRGI